MLFLLLMVFGFAPVASAASAFDAVVRSVLRIAGRDSSGEPVYGTGFLLQGRGNSSDEAWLVTAGHLMSRIAGEKIEIGMRRQVRGVFSPAPVLVKIRQNGTPLYHSSRESDLAALKIMLPAEADCCVLARDFAVDEARLARSGFGSGVQVLIPGFPYGEACNEAGFAFVRCGVVSSFPVLPASSQPVFHVDFEVFEGYSGAPVIFSDGKDTGVLAGMVLEEVFLEELRPRGKKTARTRRGLGLARVLSGPIIKAFINSLP
ncbi:MAG: trypsin-like peptidase domain-containing protein [Candidatus Riflebacteria bacterium]|nr:trypsin-like peptidase domain-containing protein [Candidatus Riflebacteria bacterium]